MESSTEQENQVHFVLAFGHGLFVRLSILVSSHLPGKFLNVDNCLYYSAGIALIVRITYVHPFDVSTSFLYESMYTVFVSSRKIGGVVLTA